MKPFMDDEDPIVANSPENVASDSAGNTEADDSAKSTSAHETFIHTHRGGEKPHSPSDTLPNLAEQLRNAERTAAEHHDAWLRAKAELENMRRRAQDDVTKASKFAIEKFATELLSVKDSLEQTLAVKDASLDAIREGAELTLRNLSKAFEKSKITEINPVGEKFDPHKHQAMSAIESAEAPNTVLQVFQKGYAIDSRVLRPAMVAVAKAAS